MARSLWEVFMSKMRRNYGEKEGEKEKEGEVDETGDGFAPSLMDLSVRFSHGGSDSDIERELHKIDERAKELEKNQPDE